MMQIVVLDYPFGVAGHCFWVSVGRTRLCNLCQTSHGDDHVMKTLSMYKSLSSVLN
jgi:hypothetical protein